MAEKVGDRLRDLAAFLENELAVENVQETISHLQAGVEEAMVRSRAQAQQCTIFLFQSHDPPNLLEFLENSDATGEDMRKRDISHARIQVLEILAGFVKAYSRNAALTRKPIADTLARCQTIARTDWSNKVRAVALKVVINVLKYASGRISAQDVEPKEYVAKLFYDLKFGKITQTAKGTMLEVIGYVASIFPTHVEQIAKELIPWIEDRLEKQFTSPTPEMLLVKGLLIALARLVTFDTDRYSTNEAKRLQVFSYLSRILGTTVDGQLTRFHVTKAALFFLSEYCDDFRRELGCNGYMWYSYMKYCVTTENKTIKEHSLTCADAVLKTLGCFLLEERHDTSKKTLNRILKNILPVLSASDTASPLMAYALMCLGQLSGAARFYLGEGGFLKVEDKLHKFGEGLLVLDRKSTAIRWSVFSRTVQCVASFAEQSRSTEIGDAFVTFCGDIVCHILNAYPRCLWKSKVMIYKPVLQIIGALNPSGQDSVFTDRIVYHLLLLTISNITDTHDMVALYHPETGSLESRLLFEFENLWVRLLPGKKYHQNLMFRTDNRKRTSNSSEFRSSTEGQQSRRMLFDSLCRSFLQVISGLNLTYRYDPQSGNGGYKPTVVRDHTIMLNLTEFAERLMPHIDTAECVLWIPTWMRFMVQKSQQLPMVSGFYRILRVLAVKCDDSKYFGNLSDSNHTSDSSRELRLEYTSFLVQVVDDMRFYKDELLVACAGCVLASPVQLLQIDAVLQALIPAFVLGKTYLPAAEIAIDFLERWQRDLPSKLETALDRIVPVLAPFLEQIVSTEGDELNLNNYSAKNSAGSNVTDESEWSKFQRRVLTFLAKSGGTASHIISQGNSSSIDKRRGLQSPALHLSMTFKDIPTEVALDELLHHVGHLASGATDRRVKIGASEVYQALVSYLCGMTATHPHTSGSKSAYFELWKSTFSTLRMLATDVEKVCRSLFAPQLFQLTEWFCKGSDTYPYEYSCMLDEFIDGLSHGSDTGAREISGKCVSICLSCCVADATGSVGIAKADAIFQRLFSLCRHPGQAQRVGAATAISYFLRTLDEESSVVVSTFALRCLKNFLFSLRLCESHSRRQNRKANNAQNVITKAIAKLQRAISRSPKLFMDCRAETSSDARNLVGFTEWLFSQCSRPEHAYRMACRQLFFAFSQLVETSCKTWMTKYASTNNKQFIGDIFAPVDCLVLELGSIQLSSKSSMMQTVEWMDQLEASLECFTWSSDFLGEKAFSILSRIPRDNTTSDTNLKRKSIMENNTEIASDVRKQATISSAINSFLQFGSHEMHSIKSLVTSEYQTLLDMHQSYIHVARALCEFIARYLGELDDGKFVSSVVDLTSASTWTAIFTTVVNCIIITKKCGAVENSADMESIRKFCVDSLSCKNVAPEAMQSVGNNYVAELISKIEQESGTDSDADYGDVKELLLHTQVVHGLVEFNVVNRSAHLSHANVFVLFARNVLERSQRPSPTSRLLAIELLKVACLFGWDFKQIVEDVSLKKALVKIFGDIIAFLSTCHLRKQAIAKLATFDHTVSIQHLKAMTEVLRNVASTAVHKSRSSDIDDFVEALLPHAKKMCAHVTRSPGDIECQRLLLEFILHEVEIFQNCSPALIGILQVGPLYDIHNVVIEVLKRRECSYFVKSDCLTVLAALTDKRLSTHSDLKDTSTLDTLMTFVVEEFPIASHDVRVGSRDYDMFALLLGKLLGIVERACRVDLLPILQSTLNEGEKHLFVDVIKSSLARLVNNVLATDSSIVRSTSHDYKRQFMVELTKMLLDEASGIVVRQMLLEYVFVPLIEQSDADRVCDFFVGELGQGKGVLVSRLATVVSNSADISSSVDSFITAAVSFTLVELLYRFVDPDAIRGPVNAAFLGHDNGKGRELTMLICKSASKFVTKSRPLQNEITRFTCCQAYTCLLTAVSRTQKQEKFFDQILFQNSLWVNIIDVAREYPLQAETRKFESVPLSRFSTTTLRNQQLSQLTSQDPPQSVGHRVNRDSTAGLQFFTGSSLSQSDEPQSTSRHCNLNLVDHEEVYRNVEIELDDINEHQCMVPLLRVLMQMHTDFSTAWPESTMPGWMGKLHGVLSDSTTELNIRLFLVKVVLNVPAVFSKYASLWTEKMLETLIEATMSSSANSQSQGKPEFHYLMRDCFLLLLNEWKDIVCVGPWSTTASRFVNRAIEASPNEENNFIMQDNIVVLSQLIHQWKDDISIDTNQITAFLFASHDSVRREAAEIYTSLQLISAMLNAGLANYILVNWQTESAEKSVGNGIIAALDHKRPSIYMVAAEVSGILLASLGSSLVDPFQESVVALIARYYSSEDFGRFLALLRNVTLHQPSLMDSAMLSRLSFVLPRVAGIETWALHAVECLLFAIKNRDLAADVFTHSQLVLPRFINHRNTSVKRIALEVVDVLVDHVAEATATRFARPEAEGGFGIFDRVQSEQESSVRKNIYKIAMKVYNKKLDAKLSDDMRQIVLTGISDVHDEIREDIHGFLVESGLLPQSCDDFILEMFGALFSPVVADQWVLYASKFLLSMTKDSVSYSSILFSSPLSDCEYQEASIDGGWETKNQTMTPLFSVEPDLLSAVSFTIPSQRPAVSGSIISSQTQAAGYNAASFASQLLTASLGSPDTVLSRTSMSFDDTQTFKNSSQFMSRRKRFAKRHHTEHHEQSGKRTSHRKGDKWFFREHYAMQNKAEEAILNRQRKARDQRVTIRRKYRVGRYPDIQIKLSDILEPLMALCMRHSATATVVMATIMPSVMTTSPFHDHSKLRELGLQMEKALSDGRESLVFVGAVHLAYFSCIAMNDNLVKSLFISPKTIGESSLTSGSHHSGELILEEYLIDNIENSPTTSGKSMNECWDQLYKVLTIIQKKNLLMALAPKYCTTEDFRMALEARLGGDLPTAIASYRKAESVLDLDDEHQVDGLGVHARMRSEAIRCYWERLECLETLDNWDKLRKELCGEKQVHQGTLGGIEFIWSQEPPYREQGIGSYLRSHLALSEPIIQESAKNISATMLQSFINDARQKPDRWDILQERFGIELCLSSIVLNEVSQARVQVENIYPAIIKRWNETSRIARLTRLELMQTLSSVVQVDELLSLYQEQSTTKNTPVDNLRRYSRFGTKWAEALPPHGDGTLSIWSQFYLVQRIVGDFVMRHDRDILPVSENTLELSIYQSRSHVMLHYAQTAITSDILAVASKYLKEYRELCNSKGLPKVSVHMVEVFVSHVLKLAERQAQKTANRQGHASGGLSQDAVSTIVRYYQTSTNMFDNSDILELMEMLPLHDRVAMGCLEAKTFGKAAQFFLYSGLERSTTQEYVTRAFDVFLRSCSIIPAVEPQGTEYSSTASLQHFSRSRIVFIEFIVDILFSDRQSEWGSLVDRETLVRALSENVLNGLMSGDEECSHYFPQLCELIPPFPDIVAEFEERLLNTVPMWTCLRWSSQLFALINGPIRKTIVRILEKMASEYPVALFYDFKITCTGGDLETNGDISRLSVLLSNPVMEKFVSALRLIHHPELRFKEGMREVSKLFEDGKKQVAVNRMQRVWQDCFAVEHSLLGSQIGQYNRDWARRAKRDVEKILGRDGVNVTAKTVKAAREWIMNHFTVVPGKIGVTKDMKARLSDFAEWLNEFDHTVFRLELPGQYGTHWGKPDPSSHVRILSIEAFLGVLVSKQLPKQITFHGTDQRAYTFLVKGGEDLRLDQRIEQLLDVMNKVLAAHPRSRDRNLHNTTYKVIPMTTEIGLIEWLHGTSTLKGAIEKQLLQDPRCSGLQSNKRMKLQLFNTTPAKEFETFLTKQRGATFAAKVAAPARNDVIMNFASVQKHIPGDLLRRQLVRLGADFEDFVGIRDEFASSVAVFNTCSYILGIGDRHLDNFLLDHRSGRVIGIDFGVSFGAGASVLPVPELIPFRCTRQMEMVFCPYDSANLLIQDMQAAFDALRDKKQVIESVMNVFLHEPLLDWQQSTTTHQREIFATGSASMSSQETIVESQEKDEGGQSEDPPSKRRRQARSTPTPSSSSLRTSSTDAAGGMMAWLPDVKIAIARRKLEGFSPRMLLKEELAQNPHLGKQLGRFQELVDAAGGNGIATDSSNSTAMSAMAQAQELMALATAPDLLGRTYHGWMPWL